MSRIRLMERREAQRRALARPARRPDEYERIEFLEDWPVRLGLSVNY